MPDYDYGAYRKLVSKVLRVPEEDVLPLKNGDILTIDGVVSMLGSREAEILRRRFGLYGRERQKLREIGEKFGIVGERIRQLEKRALSRLRQPSRIEYFRRLTKAGLEKQLHMKKVPLLGRNVCDFELSTRTINCLEHYWDGGITIEELANQTEVGMLSLSNFGRKGFAELKKLLQSLGLDFATRH